MGITKLWQDFKGRFQTSEICGCSQLSLNFFILLNRGLILFLSSVHSDRKGELGHGHFFGGRQLKFCFPPAIGTFYFLEWWKAKTQVQISTIKQWLSDLWHWGLNPGPVWTKQALFHCFRDKITSVLWIQASREGASLKWGPYKLLWEEQRPEGPS